MTGATRDRGRSALPLSRLPLHRRRALPRAPLLTLPEELHRLAAPVFGEDTVAPGDADLTIRARGRAARRADHRHRPRPRRRRPAGAERAARDLAGQRRRPLPPRGRPASGAARPELHRRRPDAHRRRGPLPLRHGEARRLSVEEPPERVAAGAHPLLRLRPRLHAAARHADVLPRRSALPVRPDLQLRPRPEGARAARSPGSTSRRPSPSGPSATSGTSSCDRRRSRNEDAVADGRARSSRFGLCAEPQNELPGGSVRIEGQVFDGEGAPVERRDARALEPRARLRPLRDRRRGPLLVPRAGRTPRRFELMVFARGLLKPVLTRLYLDGDGRGRHDGRAAHRRRLSLRRPPPGRRRNRASSISDRHDSEEERPSAHARSPRSAPTTSAACFAPPRLLQARDDHAAGRIDAGELRRVEDECDRRRSCASRKRSGSARRPTASSAAPPGTWTSSTSSTAITKEAGHIAVTFHNEDGDIELTPGRAARRRQARRLEDDLRRRLPLPPGHGRRRTCRS